MNILLCILVLCKSLYLYSTHDLLRAFLVQSVVQPESNHLITDPPSVAVLSGERWGSLVGRLIEGMIPGV